MQKSQTVNTPTGYTVVGTYTSGNPTLTPRRSYSAGLPNPATPTSLITFGASIAKSVDRGRVPRRQPQHPVDVPSSAGNDKVTSIAVPSVTTTAANERLVNIAGEANATGAWTVPTG